MNVVSDILRGQSLILTQSSIPTNMRSKLFARMLNMPEDHNLHHGYVQRVALYAENFTLVQVDCTPQNAMCSRLVLFEKELQYD